MTSLLKLCQWCSYPKSNTVLLITVYRRTGWTEIRSKRWNSKYTQYVIKGQVLYDYLTHCRNNTRCGYEVPGMFLLQEYLCILNSLLSGVTFKVLPLSSYALSPTVGNNSELLLGNSFQCPCHISWMSSVSWNLRPFKAHFIFGERHKSF
jgi:hypothetical protein